MLLICCPWCGPRDESDFYCGGEAYIQRPSFPHKLTDEEWADYLFMSTNTMGLYFERWYHNHGCRQWFNLARDTATNKILAVYKIGEKPILKVEK